MLSTDPNPIFLTGISLTLGGPVLSSTVINEESICNANSSMASQVRCTFFRTSYHAQGSRQRARTTNSPPLLRSKASFSSTQYSTDNGTASRFSARNIKAVAHISSIKLAARTTEWLRQAQSTYGRAEPGQVFHPTMHSPTHAFRHHRPIARSSSPARRSQSKACRPPTHPR